jgi:hypothetical protein
VDITIEGKRFEPIRNGSFAHDIWLTKKIREAGLSNVAIGDDETEDQFIERIAMAAYESGAALELLGGLFIPAGADARSWTPELATQSAEFFGNVTDPESKRELRKQIAAALFYFFVNALASSKTSPKSGRQGMKEVSERRAIEDASASETGAS